MRYDGETHGETRGHLWQEKRRKEHDLTVAAARLGLTNTQTNVMHIQEVGTHMHAHHRPVDFQAGSADSQRGLITANVAAKEKKMSTGRRREVKERG